MRNKLEQTYSALSVFNEFKQVRKAKIKAVLDKEHLSDEAKKTQIAAIEHEYQPKLEGLKGLATNNFRKFAAAAKDHLTSNVLDNPKLDKALVTIKLARGRLPDFARREIAEDFKGSPKAMEVLHNAYKNYDVDDKYSRVGHAIEYLDRIHRADPIIRRSLNRNGSLSAAVDTLRDLAKDLNIGDVEHPVFTDTNNSSFSRTKMNIF